MQRLPLFVDLRGQPVLIVGGGDVAARKYRLLRAAGARVKLIAPELTAAELSAALARGELQHIATSFRYELLEAERLVIAATDDPAVNAQVASSARERRILVNVVDDGATSDAILPAIVDRSPVIVAISTGGASPVLARRLRERLEAALEPGLGVIAEVLARWRSRIVARWPETPGRRRAIDALLDQLLPRAAGRSQLADVEARLALALEESPARELTGRVTLVGAGPGDPNLLTLGALRALQRADVILHDRLVSRDILALARRDADVIDVGKHGGGPSASQHDIHQQLLRHALDGRQVVRLKGGDACVFGRGSEEWHFLTAAGVEVDIVPGLTTALALSLAGISLTTRGDAAGVRFVTAQRAEGAPEPDWQSWASSRDTLVVYMAAPALARIQTQLLAHGMAHDTTVALVEHVSLPAQRVRRGVLAELTSLAQAPPLEAPSILVIGAVAGSAQALQRAASWEHAA